MSEENYIAEMKKRKTYTSRSIEEIDLAICLHEQLMTILKPHIPEFSEEAIAPYKCIFWLGRASGGAQPPDRLLSEPGIFIYLQEVKSLGEIEAIDNTIY